MKHLFLFGLLAAALSLSSCQKEEPDPCAAVTCLNGGVCTDGLCYCPDGFSGLECQTQDLCFNVTCLNGGTCVDGTCDCPTGYTGSDCSTRLTPTSITINQLTITNYPTVQIDGSAWDLNSGPDVFLTLSAGNVANQTDYVSTVVDNVNAQSNLTFSANLPYTFTGVTNNFTLAMWDQDLGGDELMIEASFPFVNGGTVVFPNSFGISTTNFEVMFEVTWNF